VIAVAGNRRKSLANRGGYVRRKTPKVASGAKRARAAVVLTGSARSFVFPLVHHSIKTNMIDALDADIDVFVRTTTEDNIHGTGLGATGVHVKSSNEKLKDLAGKLEILQPVKIQYTTFATEEDEKNATFTSRLHQLYRKFDPRRYSMYFNRHMVYRMAVDYATENNFQYDWFVHARLDCAWVGPIEPLALFNPNVVWVQAQWLLQIPDTFALVPAQYANAFFDFDQKLQPKGEIYCLGIVCC
jgi:hypothetical protein